MRLLRSDASGNIELTIDFSDDEVPPYAILSHTWNGEDEEVHYYDLRYGHGKHKLGYEKLRFCAHQAERDRLEFFWVDTCCIDRTNSAEHSKAINSMFKWYTRAQKCYVYLADVPRDPKDRCIDTGSWEADFRGCRWFTRGWTLQELLAPDSVEFFCRHGDRLGSKTALEKLLSETTKIPVKALRGSPLSTFSRQERFLWQDGRQTKEEEDIVYSLLGIFDVSMSLIYGEGKHKARRRMESKIDSDIKGPDCEPFTVVFGLTNVIKTAHFVARESELRAMRRVLRNDGTRSSVTLHGLGGIGKTQLAIAYTIRHKEDYSAIFWINAKDEGSLKLSFMEAGKRISSEHPSVSGLGNVDRDADLDTIVAAVNSWLSLRNNTRWLMVFDNYGDQNMAGGPQRKAIAIQEFFPKSYQGSLIITTRSSQVDIGYNMHVGKLENLRDSLEILSYASMRGDISSDPSAVTVATALDGLPLALATAGAYLRQTSMGFEQYLQFYVSSWAKLQKFSPPVVSYEDRTLYSTWQLSFDQIQQRNSNSARLLHLWAYLDNQDVWFELLRNNSGDDPAWLRELVEDELIIHEVVRVLCDHGIVEVNDAADGANLQRGYSMHSCVHAWTQSVLNETWNAALARLALRCVASSVPKTTTARWWMIQRRLLKHASKTLHSNADDTGRGAQMEWAHHDLGILFRRQGQLTEAQAMFERAVQGYEERLGKDHSSTLDAAHSLAMLYVQQGRLEEAEKLMYHRVLMAKEKTLGRKHISTIASVQGLGVICRLQGRLGEAQELHQRALRGREELLGVEHVSTLEVMNSLGLLYGLQGRLDEAEGLQRRAMGGREALLGKDHTLTLKTVHNLGTLLVARDRLAEAEELFQRALKGRETTLGEDYSSTLKTVDKLAKLYTCQDKLEDAERMHIRALQGRERTLEQNHPLLLETVNALGRLYAQQHRFKEAEKMYQRAMDGGQTACGDGHPCFNEGSD